MIQRLHVLELGKPLRSMKFHCPKSRRFLPFRLGSRERDDLATHFGGELNGQMAQSANSNDADAMCGSKAVECHCYSELASESRENGTSENGNAAAH